MLILIKTYNSHYEKYADGTVKCIEDEIPFEVPEGWEWARLREIMSLSSGKTVKVRQLKEDGIYPVYGGNGINGKHTDFNVESNTIIIGRVGFYCGSIHKTISKSWVTDNALIVTLKQPCAFNVDFLVETLKYLNLGKKSVATAQPVVSGKGILELLVPIPPMDEQMNIMVVYQKIITLIDDIEIGREQIREAVSKTKSKILDLAVRGRLVPQNPDDEPASILLERIRAEKEELIKQGKIRRDRKESVIFRSDDNSYYEKIGDVVRCIDGSFCLMFQRIGVLYA